MTLSHKPTNRVSCRFAFYIATFIVSWDLALGQWGCQAVCSQASTALCLIVGDYADHFSHWSVAVTHEQGKFTSQSNWNKLSNVLGFRRAWTCLWSASDAPTKWPNAMVIGDWLGGGLHLPTPATPIRMKVLSLSHYHCHRHTHIQSEWLQAHGWTGHSHFQPQWETKTSKKQQSAGAWKFR